MKFSPPLKLNAYLLALAICIFLAPTFSFAAGKLVIDEFLVGKTGASNEDYVVLANYSDADIKLDGYSLIRKNNDGSTISNLYIFSKTANFYIKKGQKLKFANKYYTDTFDLRYSNSSSYISTDDTLVLKNGSAPIDCVGFNNAEEYEVNPIPNVRPDAVYSRREGVDTDNNENDFVSNIQVVSTVIDLNADKLVISELLPNPEKGEEWFELYNPTNLDISLTNLKICDAMTPSGSRHCYSFAKDEKLTGGSYRIYPQSLTKITLNNTGDSLELYDNVDNLLTDSGGDYGTADKGISLSLFGNEYRWTKTLTPRAQNVFTDTVEVEAETVTIPKAKTSKSKVFTTAKKTVVSAGTAEIGADTVQNAEADVKAAQTTGPIAAIQKTLVDRKVLGWALIGLAILLVVGYTLWYFRDYAKNIYDKIRRGDDSARF